MIKYEDFGAIGDGKTDDFNAIRKAHEKANETGEAIKATAGKCYYLKNSEGHPIIIKTDTNWRGASFIIDDTEVSAARPETYPSCDIFRIENDYEPLVLDENSPFIRALNENSPAILKDGKTKKLANGLGYPALLLIFNDDNIQYLRLGFERDRGAPQKEIFVIDENGNINEKTPALFDNEKITRIIAVRIDTKPITIEGGEITTLASQVHNDEERYREIARGLMVCRPNTTLVSMSHYVKNEIPKGKVVNGRGFYGDSSRGFYKSDLAANIEFRDCFATARVMYGASYEIMFNHSYDIRLIRFVQNEENFVEPLNWWVMGSNFCKNISYDGCYLTRFDAHCGVYNVSIKNSTVCSLRLTGGGEFSLENSRIKTKGYGNGIFIMLREDYGSTWRGDIKIKNCVYDSTLKNPKIETLKLIWAQWANHNFGYKTYMPSVYVDNLTFDERLGVKNVNLFYLENKDEAFSFVEDYSKESFDGTPNKNPYTAPKTVVIENNNAGVGYSLENKEFFSNTELIIK